MLIVKRGILWSDRGELDKAELIFHAALKMARDLNNFKAETHIYNVLADIAMENVDYEKAEKLYKEVLQRVLSTGTEKNDESVIEISLRLIDIYERNRDQEKVNEGYKFVLHHQRSRIAKIKLDDGHELTDSEKNSLALYGMAMDSLSKHHGRNKHYEVALKTAKEALLYSKLASGPSKQTMTLTNDAGNDGQLCEDRGSDCLL